MRKLSLILTTYNSAEHLERTLYSIEEQDYEAIEVNIKDGGSTDGTLDMIKSYGETSRFPVNWKSCPDSGIYDAMNQGFALSSGEVIVFFNDLFENGGVVSKMMGQLDKHPECVGVHADLVYASEDKVIRKWKMGPQKSIYLGWMPGHPTLFLKREIYERYGLYQTNYQVAADYEFMMRFLKDKENRLAYLPETIVRMYYGGTSTAAFSSYLVSLREGHRALKENKIPFAWVADIFRTCRVLLQFI